MLSRKQDDRQELLREVDRLSAKVRNLFMEEQEAREAGEEYRAALLKRDRIFIEAKYGRTYQRYVSGRSSTVKHPGLNRRWSVTA